MLVLIYRVFSSFAVTVRWIQFLFNHSFDFSRNMVLERIELPINFLISNPWFIFTDLPFLIAFLSIQHLWLYSFQFIIFSFVFRFSFNMANTNNNQASNSSSSRINISPIDDRMHPYYPHHSDSPGFVNCYWWQL